MEVSCGGHCLHKGLSGLCPYGENHTGVGCLRPSLLPAPVFLEVSAGLAPASITPLKLTQSSLLIYKSNRKELFQYNKLIPTGKY